MDLGSWFVTELRKEALGRGGGTISRQWQGAAVSVTYRNLERLSGEFEVWRLTKPLREPLQENAFRELLHRLERRLTYFTEPLALIELDQVGKQALLRSKPPLPQEKGVRFFQLTVSPEVRLVLQRLQNENGKTVAVPFVASYEVLERFLNDSVQLINELAGGEGAGT